MAKLFKAEEQALECVKSWWPCSITVQGNCMLSVAYGAVLYTAAEFISEGAEILMTVWDPVLIGGLLLPLLGGIPDCAMIVASALQDQPQESITVGIGTLSGSTIMLATITWAAVMVAGFADLEEDPATGKLRVAQEPGQKQLRRSWFSLWRSGITVDKTISPLVLTMLATTLLWMIQQGPVFWWGAANKNPGPPWFRTLALVTMCLCIATLLLWLLHTTYTESGTDQMEQKGMVLDHEKLEKRLVRTASMHISAQMLQLPGASLAAAPTAEEEEGSEKQPLLAGKLNRGKSWKQIGYTTPRQHLKALLQKAAKKVILVNRICEQQKLKVEVDLETLETQQPKTLMERSSIVLCGFSYLLFGTCLIMVFADPMVECVMKICQPDHSEAGGSHIAVSPYFVSFVVNAVISNTSELLSCVKIASKRTKAHVSVAMAQCYGACLMNNSLGLGVFSGLIYYKGLQWLFTAEVMAVVGIQWVLGALTYKRQTFPMWYAILIVSLYPIAVGAIVSMNYLLKWP